MLAYLTKILTIFVLIKKIEKSVIDWFYGYLEFKKLCNLTNFYNLIVFFGYKITNKNVFMLVLGISVQGIYVISQR